MKRFRVLLPAAAVLAATATVPLAAQSATDTTAPVLRSPLKASFVVGQQLRPGELPDCVENPSPADLRLYLDVTFKWRSTDESPVTYSLKRFTGTDGDEEVLTGSTRTSWDDIGANINQDCGGGNWSVSEWTLTATDSAGNSTSNLIHGGRIQLTQDGGLSDESWYEISTPTITYKGKWRSALCQCWSAGRVHKTRQDGATAALTFSHVDDQPIHVGLVMHTGPDRGRFRVFVDGVRTATVDTYSPADRARVLIYQVALPDDSHRMKIVNLATRGRPRIDLDAIVTN